MREWNRRFGAIRSTLAKITGRLGLRFLRAMVVLGRRTGLRLLVATSVATLLRTDLDKGIVRGRGNRARVEITFVVVTIGPLRPLQGWKRRPWRSHPWHSRP